MYCDLQHQRVRLCFAVRFRTLFTCIMKNPKSKPKSNTSEGHHSLDCTFQNRMNVIPARLGCQASVVWRWALRGLYVMVAPTEEFLGVLLIIQKVEETLRADISPEGKGSIPSVNRSVSATYNILNS